MGKSYAFLVLAICLSSTITSCAKTENNKTEEYFFAQKKMGNDNKNEESARDFTDDFMHALKNMDNGGNEHDDSSVPYGDSLKSDMLKSFENCLETDLPKKDHATIRAIRTHLLLKEKENEEYHFLQRAMTSLKAIVIGG